MRLAGRWDKAAGRVAGGAGGKKQKLLKKQNSKNHEQSLLNVLWSSLTLMYRSIWWPVKGPADPALRPSMQWWWEELNNLDAGRAAQPRRPCSHTHLVISGKWRSGSCRSSRPPGTRGRKRYLRTFKPPNDRMPECNDHICLFNVEFVFIHRLPRTTGRGRSTR